MPARNFDTTVQQEPHANNMRLSSENCLTISNGDNNPLLTPYVRTALVATPFLTGNLKLLRPRCLAPTFDIEAEGQQDRDLQRLLRSQGVSKFTTK